MSRVYVVKFQDTLHRPSVEYEVVTTLAAAKRIAKNELDPGWRSWVYPVELKGSIYGHFMPGLAEEQDS